MEKNQNATGITLLRRAGRSNGPLDRRMRLIVWCAIKLIWAWEGSGKLNPKQIRRERKPPPNKRPGQVAQITVMEAPAGRALLCKRKPADVVFG